jgi:hypothetical protein
MPITPTSNRRLTVAKMKANAKLAAVRFSRLTNGQTFPFEAIPHESLCELCFVNVSPKESK